MPGLRPLRAARWLALLALLASPARALDDPALRTRVEQLENGLTVLLLEDDTTPVVSFQVFVRAGSSDESRYTGLAHLFEHMMFKGSANLGPERHSQILEERGGRVNAYTTRDVTVYFEDVTAETLPLVIELEAERFANLRIDAETLASEREVVLEERRLRVEDDPNGRAWEALFALAFRAHPYRWPVIGWRSDVEAVTVSSCRSFFDAYYAPNNLVVVAVGAFDAEATLERIEKSFGGLEPAASIPRNPTREPEQRGPRRDTVHFDVRSPILLAAWHAPATGHPDAEALDVLGQVLSGGRSSRLHRRLVREEQQALYASGGYSELDDAGLFLASIGVRPDGSIDTSEELLLEELGRVRSELVGDAELARAKRQLEVLLVDGLATNAQLARRIGAEYLSLGRIRPLEERLEAIRRVTAEDVRRVARSYVQPSRRSVVRVTAPPDAQP